MDENDVSNLAKREAVSIAIRILSGELGIVAGCRQLTRLGHEAVEDFWGDADFSVFGALVSDTDHLPSEEQRELWEQAAFAEKQREVARYEEEARAEVLAACRSIVTRLGSG